MIYKPASKISIDGTMIGKKNPVYFIAEIGSNFDGDLNRAIDLIHLAKNAGADAVKFQHYTAASLVSDHGFRSLGNLKSHQSVWKKSVFQTYEDASLQSEWTESLRNACDEARITFFTSPYSLDLVSYVDPYVSAYKVGSGDITWLEIINDMASRKKPILLATGASSLEDVKRAVNAVLERNPNLILMQCNTNYTAGSENYQYLQLNVLKVYEDLYPGVVLGLSDHMPGHISVLGAVSLGARVIEKHFTDSNDRVGPDHAFAMNPSSWREMVERTRELELALGDGVKKIEENERETAVVQRRSIRSIGNLEAGTILKKSDLQALRPCPADGIPPYEIEHLIGRTLVKNLVAGEYLRWDDIS